MYFKRKGVFFSLCSLFQKRGRETDKEWVCFWEKKWHEKNEIQSLSHCVQRKRQEMKREEHGPQIGEKWNGLRFKNRQE